MIEAPRSQYGQIADVIRTRIADGTYPPGGALPSEDRLADEFGVSRVTVNRALGLLRVAGDVRVRRGAGTVVRTLPRILRDAAGRYAARGQGAGAGAVEVSRLGLRSRTDYRRIAPVTPPADVAAILGLAEGEQALLRSRVLYAQDEPTQLADSYLPWSLVAGSAELLRPDAGVGGSYGRLADLGHGPVRFREDVEVRLPTDEERQVLGVEETQPVFAVVHVAYAAADRPVEVARHVLAGHLWTLRYAWADPPAAGS
jgi:GntR family transcriptional regulator